MKNVQNNLYNKRVRLSKNEPQQQGISYLEREGEGGGGDRGVGERVSLQAYLRLGWVWERYREEKER
jgi:hypothetical protein